MKKTIFFAVLLLLPSWLMAQEQVPQASPKNTISAEDYAEFLNTLATEPTDSSKESCQPLDESLILREGEPGIYFYSPAQGEEKNVISGISTSDVACYFQWKGKKENRDLPYSLCDLSLIDPLLKINRPITIYFEDKFIEASSGVAPVAFEKEIMSGVMLLGGLLGGASERETPEVTLTEDHQAQITQGLHRQIEREESNPRYKTTDELWNQRGAAWEHQKRAHEQLQEKNQELLLAQEKLREATEAHENRDQNQLGKFQHRIERLAQLLHYVPEPHTQLAATAADTAASALNWANEIWSTANHYQAEQHEKNGKCAVQQAEEEVHHASSHSVLLEHQARESEEEALHQEQLKTEQLARSLRPQVGWWPHEWEAWSASLGEGTSFSEEEEKKNFIQQARENLPWVTEQTVLAWQTRLQKSKGELEQVTQESKKMVAPLKKAYKQAEKGVETKVATTQKSYQLLQRAHERHKELKSSMETFLEKQGEEWNQQKINQQRQTFCDHFEQLIKNHKNIEHAEQGWKEALQQEQAQKLHAFATSQHLESTREEYERLVRRSQRAFQADQEQFQKVWPEFDLTYRPYLEWQLPFELEQDQTSPLEFGDIISKERASIEPPLEPMEEVEARGRRYLYQARVAIEEALHPKKKVGYTPQSPSSGKASPQTPTSTTEEETETSSETSTTPHEALLAWSLEQASNPAPAEQERWNARAELDRLRQESNRLAKTVQEETPEQQEAGTLFSFKTSNTKKAPSRLSYFTARTGKSSTTVKSAVPETANPQEQFQQALLAEQQAEELWLKLIGQAEEHRLARGEEPFINEEAKIDAWAFADCETLQELRSRKGLLDEKVAAQTLEESWLSNNKRWQARAQADRAEKFSQECQQELTRFFQRKDLKESKRIQQKKELEEKIREATKQAKEAQVLWKELAKAHEGVKQRKVTLDELQAFDQGVLKRWDQLQESQGPIDPEKTASLQEQPSYELVLSLQLEKEEKKAFDQTASLEAGLWKYQQAVTQEALRSAQENIPRASKAWKERLHRSQEQLQEWEKQLEDPQTSRQEAARLRGLLTQLRGVVAADQKAQSIFEKEERRLSRIEKLWKSIAAAKKEKQFERAQEAAVYFYQGDHAAWSALTEEERQQYNSAIAEKNHHYNQALASEEGFLAEMKNCLDAEQKKATQFLSWIRGSMTGKQQATLDFLKQAQEYYQERLHTLNTRKETLHLQEMTLEERKQYIQEQVNHKKEEEYRQWIEQAPQLAKQAKKKQQEAIQAARKSEAYRNTAARKLHEKRVSHFGLAAYNYEKAAENQKDSNYEAARYYYKIAQEREQAAEDCKQQAERDQAAAELHEKEAGQLQTNI